MSNQTGRVPAAPEGAQGGSGPCGGDRGHLTETATLAAAIANSLSGRDMRTSLTGCAEALAKHFDTAGVRLWVLDAESNMLDLQASSGAPRPLDPAHQRVPLGTSQVGRTAATPAGTVESVAGAFEIHDREWVRREGITAYAGHPLSFGGRILGVLELFSQTPFDRAALESLPSISRSIALGIYPQVTEWKHEEDIPGNIDQMVCIRDARTQEVLFVSPTVEKIWGVTIQSLRESPDIIMNLVHPDDRAAVKQRWNWRGSLAGTFRILRPPNAELRVLRVRTFPIPGESGAVHRTVDVTTDITDQQELEERLRHSQKMDVVGQLAGGVAHDFNNLLTIILGHSDLLKCQLRQADPLYAHLDAIHRAAERGASLTQKLLAFSKGQGRQPSAVDLSETILEIGKMMRRVIGEHIDMKVEAQPCLWSVKVDPDQIQQVILNLSINARDAMPAGGELTIHLANVRIANQQASPPPEAPPGAYVRVTVSDTGVGMPASVRERIFDPFFTTKGAKGTGLGLAMVQGTVQQSGGHIRVHSEPGQGTSFRIYLPAVDGPPEPGG